MPHSPISCNILLYKFGKNCVCNVRVHGETFLYPGFILEEGFPLELNACVGSCKRSVQEVVASNLTFSVGETTSPMAVA